MYSIRTPTPPQGTPSLYGHKQRKAFTSCIYHHASSAERCSFVSHLNISGMLTQLTTQEGSDAGWVVHFFLKSCY